MSENVDKDMQNLFAAFGLIVVAFGAILSIGLGIF